MQATIRVEGVKEVVEFFKKAIEELPRAADRDMYNVAQILGKELRGSARHAGITDYTGELMFGTIPRKTAQYEYTLVLPFYTVYLDRMRAHDVWLYNKPDLQRWAEMKIGADPDYGGKIHVRPHPFIDVAFDITSQRIKDEILPRGNISKALKKHGGKVE